MLCPNIDHNLSWTIPGIVTPCNNIVDFPKFYSVNDLRSSNEYIQLKQDNNNDIKSKFCKRCWDKESIMQESKRLHDTKLHKIYTKIDSNYLKIDSQLGDTCNSQCTTCGPLSSTIWQQMVPIIKIKGAQNETFEILEQEKYNIVQIDFGGGEPWLNNVETQIAIFQDFIAKDLAKKIKLRYNTNGSLLPKKILQIIPYFREVEITVSLDDIQDKFEYNRWPLKWNKVFENFKEFDRIKKVNHNLKITVNFTVSVFTFFRTQVFENWIKEFNINKVNYNILTTPKYFSIYSLPKEFKSFDTEYDSLIGLQHYEQWQSEFLDNINQIDHFRKTNWSKVFPEIANLLK